MNDAGNQYLGVGVEIRAMVAAVASLTAQEAEAGLGGMRQRQECSAPSSPLHILLPPILPSSLLPTPALHLLVAGLREPGPGNTPPAKTGDRRWDLGPLSPGRDMPHPYLVSGHSLTRCRGVYLRTLPCAPGTATPDMASRGRAWPPHCLLLFLGSLGLKTPEG